MTNICTIVPQSTGNEEEESQAAAQLVLGGKGRHKKNRFFLGKSPKPWVGGGQES